MKCNICQADTPIRVSAANIRDSGYGVRNVRCPLHASALRRQLISEERAKRPPQERTNPVFSAAHVGGPCRTCGRKVTVEVQADEGATFAVDAGFLEHIVCPA